MSTSCDPQACRTPWYFQIDLSAVLPHKAVSLGALSFEGARAEIPLEMVLSSISFRQSFPRLSPSQAQSEKTRVANLLRPKSVYQGSL